MAARMTNGLNERVKKLGMMQLRPGRVGPLAEDAYRFVKNQAERQPCSLTGCQGDIARDPSSRAGDEEPVALDASSHTRE